MKSLKFKMSSSKFFLALLITLGANLLMWGPVLLNIVAGTTIALLSGSEYVSLMIGIYAIYCGLNVAQKQVLGKFGISDPDLDDSKKKDNE